MTVSPLIEGVPSQMALAAALLRAYHQDEDNPRIYADPLAVPITGITPTLLAHLGVIEKPKRLRRYFFAARSRFGEEAVADAVESGVRQIVILGAGLETFAFRYGRDDVRFFEVDLPDCQAWKRSRLSETHIAVPSTVRFVPTDLEERRLRAALANHGFDPTIPTLFSWLGVLVYLTDTAVDSVLNFIGELPAPARLVLDYIEPPRSGVDQRAILELLKGWGEPWLTHFGMDEIRDRLSGFGFEVVDDLSAQELRGQYLGDLELDSEPDHFGRRVLLASGVGVG